MKPQQTNDKKTKVLSFSKKEGWFVFTEYEIPESMLEKHGKKVSETNPDIFVVFMSQLTQKVRDIFEI